MGKMDITGTCSNGLNLKGSWSVDNSFSFGQYKEIGKILNTCYCNGLTSDGIYFGTWSKTNSDVKGTFEMFRLPEEYPLDEHKNEFKIQLEDLTRKYNNEKKKVFQLEERLTQNFSKGPSVNLSQLHEAILSIGTQCDHLNQKLTTSI